MRARRSEPGFERGRWLGGVVAGLLLASCATQTESPSDGPLADALDSGVDAKVGTVAIPLTIASYPGGAGKFLLVAITVNDSAPLQVLVDTGSSGLRLFAKALGSTAVDKTTETTTTHFGADILLGHKASGTFRIGGIAATKPVFFDLVESFACDSSDPFCDPALTAQNFEDAGIQGIIGVGLRDGGAGIYNPLAQLEPPLGDGFTLVTTGFASRVGELILGAKELSNVTPIALTRQGTLPNGRPAWTDDDVRLCYELGTAPTTPPCSASVFDTGSNLDVLYAQNVPANALTNDGLLASGIRFAASHATAGFALEFTVGSPITWSLDGVIVQQDEAFTILGVGVFLSHDVAFDLQNGRISLRPH